MVAGGNGGSGRLVSVELYDVAKEQWEGGTAMTTARSSHGMVFLPDVGAMGAVMVAGGFGRSYLASVEFAVPTTTTTSTMTTTTITSITTSTITSTSTTTTSITTSTTTWLQVTDRCDLLADMCDRGKNLTCSLEVYECRYGIAEESTSKKNNVGAIVGGALGGLVFLAVLVFVAYRCGGGRGNTADAKAVENATHQDNAYA